LALETIREGGQALIFVNTRKATEAVAQRSGKYVSPLLSDDDRQTLAEISTRILGSSAEPTRVCRKLSECAAAGVAFHHAGITSSQRRIVEDAFRANQIKCVAATTTLAMGLNLPSRRVVIRDWWRYESGAGMQPIPTIEIKQMAGRAGRPRFDDYGEAVLIARTKRDERFLFENYIQGDLEGIDSQLGHEPALRTHILGSIAGAFTTTRTELMDFLGSTFFAHQQGRDTLCDLAEQILDFLVEKEMVRPENDRLQATRFGRRISELYVDPVSGVLLREALQSPKKKENFGLLHMIALTPDMMVLSLRQRDREEMLGIFYENSDRLLLADEERFPTEEMLAQIKIASVLMDWIEEVPEDTVIGRFGIGPGDLRTLVDLSDWLLYSASEIARLFRMKEVVNLLSGLRIRVEYGVKEELLELVSLRGIGRVRGRNLYNAGFKNLNAIREAGIDELAGIPAMGKALAEDIKKQVESSVAERR
jgi:helicase